MITYDMLDELEKKCLELLCASTGLKNKDGKSFKESHDKICEALRKIVIANEMMGKGIICVSGLQGAGKTTLMKNFYCLDDKYFNIALGRGEQIPVFICERNTIKTPEMYAQILEKNQNGRYERKEKKMTEQEFRNASCGDETITGIMYLELRVPYQHIRNESFAFMLLPGFEKKNDYWQSLIDFSVRCSDTAIFVFNESSFSQYENSKLVNKIKNKFKNDIIYVISQSDLSADKNEGVKITCMETMGIGKDEADRVVCAGQFDNQVDNEKWIKELKEAINKYCNSIETARKNCNQYIYEIIEDEIRPEIYKIKEALGEDNGELVFTQLENSSYLKAFDKIVADRKKKYTKQIGMALDEAFDKSQKELSKFFADSQYAADRGVKDKRIWKRTIFGENIKDIEFARNRIDCALRDSDGKYEYAKAIFKKFEETMKICEKDSVIRDVLAEEHGLFDEEPKPLSIEMRTKQKEILHDVGILLDENKAGDILIYKNPVETMKVMAEMSVQYFTLSMMSASCEKDKDLKMPDVKLDLLQVKPAEIKIQMKSVEKLFWGALGATGIDFLDDGIINTIPKIIGCFGAELAPFVGTAATVAMIGTAGIAVKKDINRLQRTEYASALTTLNGIKEQIRKGCETDYDEAMGLVRERIEKNLISYTGINKQMFKNTNAAISINRISDTLDEISREVATKQYEIGNAFRA